MDYLQTIVQYPHHMAKRAPRPSLTTWLREHHDPVLPHGPRPSLTTWLREHHDPVLPYG